MCKTVLKVSISRHFIKMAVGTRNFDRALKVNVGIEKLLRAELIRIRYKRQKVMRQIKHAQMELKSEITTRKNERFQVKIEEQELHDDIDVVLKSFEKTMQDGTNKMKDGKFEAKDPKPMDKHSIHRSVEVNEGFSINEDSSDSISSASSDENVDYNPSVQQRTNGNGNYSPSIPIESELSSSVDNWTEQMALRTDKEVSIHMPFRTIAPPASYEKVNPVTRMYTADMRRFSQKSDSQKRKDLSQSTAALHMGKYHLNTFASTNFAASKKQATSSIGNQSLMLAACRASLAPGQANMEKQRASIIHRSSCNKSKTAYFNRQMFPFVQDSVPGQEMYCGKSTAFSSADFVFTKRLGVRPTTASPKSTSVHRVRDMLHRPTTAVGFSANYNKYQHIAQDAPIKRNLQSAVETNQTKAAPRPRRALSNYGKHKPSRRSEVNQTDNLQENNIRMQLKLRQQQTENDAISRRVWRFIGKRPLGLNAE